MSLESWGRALAMKVHTMSRAEALAWAGCGPEGLAEGLTEEEAAGRRVRVKKEGLLGGVGGDAVGLLGRQFRSPLVMLLLGAMLLSLGLGDRTDALVVLAVILLSTLLGFWQEYRAARAVATLLALVQTRAAVRRGGRVREVAAEEVVRGDVVVLGAGDAIPGDGLLVESKDLYVDESALTGESYPAEKEAEAGPGGRSHAVYQGTHVVSGSAAFLVLATGADTEFGAIAERLRLRPPETDFERGLRRFGEMLIRVTLLMVLALFAGNVLMERPVLESFMFAVALAVGMTPEMLPAIVSITLARGAQEMARQQVIVRRLAAIENFGSMEVLCSDKTGTLTEGRMAFCGALDAGGEASEAVRLQGVLNATFESGFRNPIDAALRALAVPGVEEYAKCDEVPYDFLRKRLSVVVQRRGAERQHLMITKGAFANVLAVCTRVVRAGGEVPMEGERGALQAVFERCSGEGHRVLGLALRDVTGDPLITKDDEEGMSFAGFLLFDDPAKAGAAEAVQDLRRLGVEFKVISGDNRLMAGRLGAQLGLAAPRVLTGEELARLSDPALVRLVGEVAIFAEIEPNQKERILLALRRGGRVVGYLGDGINDAPALRAADVGISVEGAVDVAKEAADIVLLRRDLGVLARGVRIGRGTFANTLKYIYITTSANFGNMFSMAGISCFLPFLPLLPKQILVNNFLSDLPALGIAADAVDPEQLERPRRWDHRSIQRFMIIFGLVSSLFDYLTFAVLIWGMKARAAEFQTGWFVESLLTEVFIVLVVRTRRRCWRSRPGAVVGVGAGGVALLALVLPYTAWGAYMGLVPLPGSYLGALAGIALLYLLASELAKHWLLAWVERGQVREDSS